MKSIFIKSSIFFVFFLIFNVAFVLLFGGWTKPSLFSRITHKILAFPYEILNINYMNSEWYIDLVISPLFYSILFFMALILVSKFLKKDKIV